MFAIFYLVIDDWKWNWWSRPFTWIESNSLVVYLLPAFASLENVARRDEAGNFHPPRVGWWRENNDE